MGFCSDDEHTAFMKEVPQFEKMLVESGIILLKFWIHVSPEEQERRFQDRATDPRKRWKLSPIDLEGRRRWAEFSKYRNKMFEMTSKDYAPWRVVDGNDKRKGRLNAICSILDQIPYEFNDDAFEPIDLPPRQTAEEGGYNKSGIDPEMLVKDKY